VAADAPDQPTDMACRLDPRRALAGAQQHHHRTAGRGVINMDRQEAALAIMAVPEGELLAAMDDIDRLSDIERHRDRRRGIFEANACGLLASNGSLERIILPLLDAWRGIRGRAAELDRQLVVMARHSDACRILMSIPGIGAVTSSSFVAAIEDPANFRTSRSVGAWLGLTTRRYQSGEVDYDGHISRRGDSHLRGLLYEAATVILTRAQADSSLRTWGLKLKEKIGFKRAAIAVARKLSVIMHSMLTTGEIFNRSTGALA